MERHFERDIDALKEQVLLMGGRAEQLVRKSIESLVRRDTDLASAAFDDDRQIDRLEIEIEERCIRLFALQQPLATDLRFIMADLATAMLHEALDAFVRRDAETARRLCLKDDEVDQLNRQVFRELVSYM